MTLFSHDSEHGGVQATQRAALRQSLPVRCGSVKRYTGLRKPRCCGGTGCQACWNIYEIKHG